MKHLNKLIIVAVLLVGLLSQAQDANNTWSLSFGANAVDTRVSAASSLKDQFSDYFNTKDNWNFLPSVSYLNLSKYAGDNFSYGVTGSINKMSKFVNKKALQYEEMVWSLRNTYPWNTFPYEQKTIYEHILPQIPNQYIIHDPYILNCIIRAYPDKVANALFVHMCGTSEEDRNKIMENIII